MSERRQSHPSPHSALYAPLVTPSAEGLRLQFAFDAALAPLTPGWAAALRGWMDVGAAPSLPGLCAGLAAEGGAVFTAVCRWPALLSYVSVCPVWCRAEGLSCCVCAFVAFNVCL